MKIVIVGAGGQLGTALQPVYRNHDVTALARTDLDISDRDAVLNAIDRLRPDVVINAAAYNFVDPAEKDPAPAFAANEAGPRHLAEATARVGATVVHVSTDYVFDGRKRAPYVETDEPNPLSQYGRSKLAGEIAVRETNPRSYIVRTAWVYHDTGRNFFRLMLGFSEKGAVRVVNDQFSSPTYAPHLADGIRQLVDGGAFGTYHLVGSGGAASRYDELVEFYQHIGHHGSVSPVSMAEFPQPAPRPAYTVMETIRTPKIILPDWREGIALFAKAFVAGGRK